MPRGKYVNHKGRARHFTSPEELEQERKKLEQKKWRKKQNEGEESEEEEEEAEGEGAAGGKTKEGSDESTEEDSDDEQHKAKGVEGLIEIENPNRIVKKEKKLSKLGMPEPDGAAAEEVKPELSRKEREELERQRAKAHYQKLHAEGKTEQARADLARLAIIRKQREEAAAKRDEEKKAKEAAKTAKSDETGKALGKKS
ncbi:28 kDa heat- and acid-stable phosphoprotein [Orchesella cincta]|uniref:28 kDa heat-and acid-stable phosphoprotein n=1 Tax=Orchesella cincta TaxID=48709 RepID=A0A1D2ME22_ORCCI|nr:28 kDa heat- and acid-stable phosphoprotein [Orchesella cincta]